MRKLGIVFALVVMWGALTLSPIAQSGLTITAPANGVRLAAGPDYATDVLGDPWDMSNAEDIGKDPNELRGWASDFAVANGTAGGTTVALNGQADTNLPLLYRGFHNIVNPGRTGKRYPISSSFYKKVAYRMYSAVANESPQAYWFHYPWDHPSGLGFGARWLPKTQVGYKIYTANLNEQLQPNGSAWTNGSVVGLRLDPNNTQTGHVVRYDWVRVTRADAETTAIMPVQWTGSGTTAIDVIDAAGSVLNVASVAGTSYSFNYGVLPPGAYTLRLTRGGSQATRSFSVNNPPLVKVTDPDEAGGTDDFATTVLHDAWDMNNSGDVKLSPNVSGASYSGGAFHGTNTNGDASVFVLAQATSPTPIDTAKYRYLTYRLRVDGAYNLGLGSVARVFWGSQSSANAATITTTQDIIVWPGTNSYTIDLASLHFGSDGALEQGGARQLWTAAPVRWFRLDPHEFAAARAFHIEDVRLTAMDQSSSAFVIRWTGDDPDGDPATLALYYDTNTNPNDGRTLITQGVALSAGQYTWNTSGVSPGTYWVYALASDGLDARGFYSTGSIKILDGPETPASDPFAVIDSPVNGANVSTPFTISGWAVDRGSSSGTGVNQVEVYAQPLAGGSQIALGAATYGSSRPDVGAAFGSSFTNSGYSRTVSSLSPGSYQLIVSARSTVTGTFSITKTVNVTVVSAATVPLSSNPLVWVDTPRTNTSVGQNIVISGWAVDRAATSGPGMDAVRIYRRPAAGGAQTLVGNATYGLSRPDVAAAYGANFQNCGWRLNASLPTGTYDLLVQGHSTRNQAWTTRTIRVTVQ